MSYTMTLDMPTKEAMFVRQSPQLRHDLEAIFLAVIATRMKTAKESASTDAKGNALSRWDRLVAAGHGRLKRPYKFKRSDAYDEDIG